MTAPVPVVPAVPVPAADTPPTVKLDAWFTLDGREYRVLVVGDVVALPSEGWSLGNFGEFIDISWMLDHGRLPGNRAHRRLLAELVRHALATAHGYRVFDCQPFQLQTKAGV